MLEEAHALLEGERQRLEKRSGTRASADIAAGSPSQTLHGVRDLASAVATARERIALAAG
ncbi:hypothetical protein ACFWN1_30450 [Streptomyces sp. NPDC058459]|uniref:hypothetical protein n=1 Tax=Streptomyces sp. NPDC058459 TaxID=3346508 RepID=UPI00365970FC